jgi:exosortase
VEYTHTRSRPLTAHDLAFLLFWSLSLLLFGKYLEALVRLSLRDDRYSHILVIPIMSAALVYLQRKRVFAHPRYAVYKSAPLLALGIALFCLAQTRLIALNSNDLLSLVMLAMILLWMAGFMLCYGAESFRTALFPLLFLLLMIPIPTVALADIVLALQKGSAVMTYALFRLLGVPVFWQHFKVLLPGVEIEIAEECSGIRSSLALFITSILAGHMFLQSNWRKAFFSLFTIPVVIFKNAVRIVTISCLGVYVDPGFLSGKLHRYGGLPFSLVSLAILAPLLFALQRGEHGRGGAAKANEKTLDGHGGNSTSLTAPSEPQLCPGWALDSAVAKGMERLPGLD